MTFDEAFPIVLKHEGGFVDHPSDPGGATNWGITVAVARQHGYTGHMRDLPQSVAKEIYRRSYWLAVRADELHPAIRYPLFDAAVNSGVRQAVLWLQEAAGTRADGVIGPLTLGAANANPERTRNRMIGARLAFLTRLRTWPTFGTGWARRIAAVIAA